LEAPEFGRSRFCKNKSGFVNLYEGFDDTKVLKELLVLLIYVQVCGTKDRKQVYIEHAKEKLIMDKATFEGFHM
jgi:hypothetical protein